MCGTTLTVPDHLLLLAGDMMVGTGPPATLETVISCELQEAAPLTGQC